MKATATRTSCVLVLAVAGALVAGRARGESPRRGVCQQDGAKIVGVKPVQVGKGVTAPRKVHNVQPKYSELPPDTRANILSGCVRELLIDAQGKVAKVWTIKEFRFTPPFPAFNRAIVDAVGRWEFEPVAVDGKAVPACMTVWLGANWQ